MIDGLRLTISGEELRRLFEHRIEHHERCVKHWKREQARTPEEQIDDEPLLPEQICGHEAAHHEWRADVLRFIRDHVEDAEYRPPREQHSLIRFMAPSHGVGLIERGGQR